MRDIRHAQAGDRPEVGALILGRGLCGPSAGEMIAEGVLAIEMGATAMDLELTIHPHPTLSETFMEAAEIFYGTSPDIYMGQKNESISAQAQRLVA